MYKTLVLVLSSLLFAPITWGMNDDKAMQQLLKNLDGFSQFQAAFKQVSLDEKGAVMQLMTGRLIIEKPDHFFWQSDEPSAQKLISDGKTIWHFDLDLEQVIVQQYSQQKQQSPLLLILEDKALLKTRFDVQFVSTSTKDAGDKDDATIQRFLLLPKQDLEADKIESVESIVLGFNSNKLVLMSFVDVLKQKTQLTFSDVTINKAVDAATFTFKIPVDADVLYE